MFQAREPQESLWQSEFLITPRKAKLMRRSWTEVFRNEALVLIEEERFAPMYSPDMGRPNRAVQTVLGVLVLKEMFDLMDMEALEELEFNLLWHHALRLEMEEAHLAQKPLAIRVVTSMRYPSTSASAPTNSPSISTRGGDQVRTMEFAVPLPLCRANSSGAPGPSSKVSVLSPSISI